MTLFVVLVCLLSPPVVELALHARRTVCAPPPARGSAARPSTAAPLPLDEREATWSALDDHQLTRLLVTSSS